MKEIWFVSQDSDFCTSISSKLGVEISAGRVKVFHGDVRTIVPKENTVFVSPSNSLGFMDGGYDEVLLEILGNDTQKVVQKRISQLATKTNLGRPYLQIGAAILTKIYPNTFLISAPTMFLPEPVPDTMNAFWSTMAALVMWSKAGSPLERIVFTSHCVGIGKMCKKEAATQMALALLTFDKQVHFPTKTFPGFVGIANVDDHQPRNFQNREIQSDLALFENHN